MFICVCIVHLYVRHICACIFYEMKVIDINDITASDTFEMGTLGEPKELRDDVLPTGLEVYKHFLHLTNVKCASGAWKQRTDIHTKVSCLLGDISSLWNRTGIPHMLATREGERKVHSLVLQCRKLNKVALCKRGDTFGQDLYGLFDVALCLHPGSCTCSLENKVPLTWKAFLADQRGDRVLEGVLRPRTLSLRSAQEKEREELESRERVRL